MGDHLPAAKPAMYSDAKFHLKINQLPLTEDRIDEQNW